LSASLCRSVIACRLASLCRSVIACRLENLCRSVIACRLENLCRLAILCGLASLCLPACNETDRLDRLTGPDAPAIVGRVTSGGRGMRVQVGAETVGADSTQQGPWVAEVRSDEDGEYLLPLPPGRYRLATGGVYYAGTSAAPDHRQATILTIRAGAKQPLRADFTLAEVAVRLRIPAALGKVHARICLREQRPGSLIGREVCATATAQGGLFPCNLQMVTPGRHRLSLLLEETGETFLLPDPLDPAQPAEIVIEPGLTTLRYEADLDLGWSFLRGDISGSWQVLGEEPPRVEALRQDRTVTSEAVVAADGSFRLAFLSRPSVRLRVSGNVQRWIGGADFESAREFAPAEGETLVVPALDEGGLRIRFLADTLLAALRPIIRLVDADGRARAASARVLSGGSVPMALLPPGPYRLWVGPDGPGETDLLPQWYDRAESREQADWIEVPGDGRVVSVDLRTTLGGRIRGVVEGGSGEAGWLSLAVTPAAVDTLWARLPNHDSTRAFVVRGLPPGHYKIGVSAGLIGEDGPSAAPITWLGDTAAWDSAAVVTIRGTETVDGLIIRI